MKGAMFADEMVCQLLRRHKTHTRRLKQLGKIGQVLYVKEAFALGEADTVDYKVLAPDHGFNSERSKQRENGGRP